MDGNKTSLPNYLSGHSPEGDSDINGILKFLLEEKSHMGENPYLNLLIEGIRKGSISPDLARESYEKYLQKEGIRRPPDSDAKTRLPYDVTQHSAFVEPPHIERSSPPYQAHSYPGHSGQGQPYQGQSYQGQPYQQGPGQSYPPPGQQAPQGYAPGYTSSGPASSRAPHQQRREGRQQAIFGRSTGFDEETFGRMDSDKDEVAASEFALTQETSAGDKEETKLHSHLFDDFDIPEYASPPPPAAQEQNNTSGRNRFEPPSFAQPYDQQTPVDSESLLLDYDATRAGGGFGVYVPPSKRSGSGVLGPTDAHDYYQRTRMPGDFGGNDLLPPIIPTPPSDFGTPIEPSGAASLAEEPTDFDEPGYQSEGSENSATSFLPSEDSEGEKTRGVERLFGGTPAPYSYGRTQDFEGEETFQHQFDTDAGGAESFGGSRRYDGFASAESALPMFGPRGDYVSPFENPERHTPRAVNEFVDHSGASGNFEELDESTECDESPLSPVTDEAVQYDSDSFECEKTSLSSTSAGEGTDASELDTLDSRRELDSMREEGLHFTPRESQPRIPSVGGGGNQSGYISQLRTQADPVEFPERSPSERGPFVPIEGGNIPPASILTEEQVTAESQRDLQTPVNHEAFAQQLNIDSFVIDQFFGDQASPFASGDESERTGRGEKASARRNVPPPPGRVGPPAPPPSVAPPSATAGVPVPGPTPVVPPPEPAPPAPPAPVRLESVPTFQGGASLPSTPPPKTRTPLPRSAPYAESSSPLIGSRSSTAPPPPVSRDLSSRGAPSTMSRPPIGPPPAHRPPPSASSAPGFGISQLPNAKTPPPPPNDQSVSGSQTLGLGISAKGNFERKGRSVPPPPPPASHVPNSSSSVPGMGLPAAPPPKVEASSGGQLFKSEECIPQFIVPFTELSQRGISIDHRMAYALSQIDGFCCIRDICDIVGIPVEEMIDALNELAKKNIVRKK